MTNAISRRPQVVRATGMSGSAIDRAVADGHCPAPAAPGARALGWERSTLEAWLASRKRKGV